MDANFRKEVVLSRYYNHFMALCILSGTTQVSWYQKKHLPTHTHCGHQSSLFASSIYYDPCHPPHVLRISNVIFSQFLEPDICSFRSMNQSYNEFQTN